MQNNLFPTPSLIFCLRINRREEIIWFARILTINWTGINIEAASFFERFWIRVFKYENLKLNTAPLKLIRYPNQLPLVDFFVKSFSRRREAARFQSPFCSLKACRSLKAAKFKKISALFSYIDAIRTYVVVHTSNDDNFNEFCLNPSLLQCTVFIRRSRPLGVSRLSLSAERE